VKWKFMPRGSLLVSSDETRVLGTFHTDSNDPSPDNTRLEILLGGEVPDMLRKLRRLTNLASHPCFPDVKELPAWSEALEDCKQLVSDYGDAEMTAYLRGRKVHETR
jgi:hypothetical protein